MEINTIVQIKTVMLHYIYGPKPEKSIKLKICHTYIRYHLLLDQSCSHVFEGVSDAV